MRKLKERTEDEEEPETAGEYFMVETRSGCYWVSAVTAAEIGRQLSRRWPPRWLRFVDHTGSRTWVRTSTVEAVCESTEAQRSRDRAFRRACNREAKADRDWGEDED